MRLIYLFEVFMYLFIDWLNLTSKWHNSIFWWDYELCLTCPVNYFAQTLIHPINNPLYIFYFTKKKKKKKTWMCITIWKNREDFNFIRYFIRYSLESELSELYVFVVTHLSACRAEPGLKCFSRAELLDTAHS